MLRLSVSMLIAACLCAAPAAVQAGGTQRQPRDLGGDSCSVVKLRSHSYVLYRRGVSCSFAKGWVRRLATSRGRSRPAGWSCSSGDGFRADGYCESGQRHVGWSTSD